MKILSFVLGALLSVAQSVKTEEYAQFESKEFEQQILMDIGNFNAEQNQMFLSKKVGGPVCQGFEDYSVFNLK